MPQIPESDTGLTAAWLTSALASRHPSVVVQEVTVERVLHGASTKVCLRLSYNEAGHSARLPRLLWAKSGWEAHSPWLDSTSQIDAREARFYAEIYPLGIVNVPHCYFAAADAEGRGIVLLEDLQRRGVRFGECTRDESVDHVANMLEQLARLHARWWDLPDAPVARGLDVPMRRDRPSCEWPRANGPEVIARYLDSSRGQAIPAEIKSAGRIDAAFWSMVDHMRTAEPRCVLHGDTHPGNTFFDADGSSGLFDWQTLSVGPWAHDVSYYISSALAVESRRSSERALLRHYLEALGRRGVSNPPSFEQAWELQRRYIAYGLHIWITNRTDFQSEPTCTAMATRLGTAAQDYDFFEAWNV